ncbi:hypothetical protein, partial [Escherichia coli]|uniref:hypothetical protein n=1 Tax=Escherichia coli TaxID=562 RepID=UPI001BC87C99
MSLVTKQEPTCSDYWKSSLPSNVRAIFLMEELWKLQIFWLIQIITANSISLLNQLIWDVHGFAPIFPDTCYHLTHYWPAAADIPVASDNPVHYAGAIRYNAR